MPLALIGAAQVGVGVDLDNSDGLCHCADDAAYRTVGKGVFAAKYHGDCTCACGAFSACGDGFHHVRKRAAAVHRFLCGDACGTGF